MEVGMDKDTVSIYSYFINHAFPILWVSLLRCTVVPASILFNRILMQWTVKFKSLKAD